MGFGQMAGHTRTDGFADHISREVIRQQPECFLTGSKETLLPRRTGPRAIAGILEDEYIHGRGRMNWVGKVIPVKGATGVAVNDQHAARRSSIGGNFPADNLAGRIFPRNKSMFGCLLNHQVARNFRWKINQAALKNQHRQDNQYISYK